VEPARAIQFNAEPARGGMPRRQQILLPFIALIAIGGGSVAALAITNQPQTRSLQREVSSLQAELGGARQELRTLQRTVASRSAVNRLSKSVAGLGRTVGGLQSSAVPVKVRVDALSVCVPQLQRELAAGSVRGRGKKAAPVGLTTLSPGCAALLGGG
jgi:hypothetical protein